MKTSKLYKGGNKMRNWFYFLAVFGTIFLLTGCTTSNNEAVQGQDKAKLSTLALTNDGTLIKTIRGAYSWTIIDEATGNAKIEMVDIAAPPGLVSINDAVPFSLSKPTVLTFEHNPVSYKINIWNEEEIIATYTSFADIKERGPCIIEIAAIWDEGNITYVAAIDIKG